MKCKYVGTGVFEGMCLGTKEVDFCVGNERCAMFKPDTTTNADRIRAGRMTRREAAKQLVEIWAGAVRLGFYDDKEGTAAEVVALAVGALLKEEEDVREEISTGAEN